MLKCYVKEIIRRWLSNKYDSPNPPLKQLDFKIVKYIENIYHDFKHINKHGLIYMFLNDMNDTPICKVCNKNHVRTFRNYNEGFSNFCSSSCSNKSPETKEKKKQSFIKHYGVENCFQSEIIKNQTKNTLMEKYGVDNISKSKLHHDKKLETCKTHYGCEYPFQSKEIRDACIDKWITKYGATNPSSLDYIQKKKEATCFRNYGVLHPSQSFEVRQKQINTTLERYGVENPLQCYDIIKRSRRKYFYDNIYFDSLPEIIFYMWVKSKNKKIITHGNIYFPYEYNGKIFKYYPDFYLEDDDIYIEIKGEHFFDSDGNMVCPYDRNRDPEFQEKFKLMKTISNLKIIKDKELFDYIGLKVKSHFLRKVCDFITENHVMNYNRNLLDINSLNFYGIMKELQLLAEKQSNKYM